MFNRHTIWTHNGVTFTAVKAEHSDPSAIGVIIESEGKKYYHTGDTLYNSDIFSDIPSDVYAMFSVVNGKGNNMNIADAQRFAKRVSPKYFVPMHWGLHDDLYPSGINFDRTIIPSIYEEVKFQEEV